MYSLKPLFFTEHFRARLAVGNSYTVRFFMHEGYYLAFYVAAAVLCASLPKPVGDPILIAAGPFSLVGFGLATSYELVWYVELLVATVSASLLLGFIRVVRYARLKGHL
jgi:hypothetical protein